MQQHAEVRRVLGVLENNEIFLIFSPVFLLLFTHTEASSVIINSITVNNYSNGVTASTECGADSNSHLLFVDRAIVLLSEDLWH